MTDMEEDSNSTTPEILNLTNYNILELRDMTWEITNNWCKITDINSTCFQYYYMPDFFQQPLIIILSEQCSQ